MKKVFLKIVFILAALKISAMTSFDVSFALEGIRKIDLLHSPDGGMYVYVLGKKSSSRNDDVLILSYGENCACTSCMSLGNEEIIPGGKIIDFKLCDLAFKKEIQLEFANHEWHSFFYEGDSVLYGGMTVLPQKNENIRPCADFAKDGALDVREFSAFDFVGYQKAFFDLCEMESCHPVCMRENGFDIYEFSASRRNAILVSSFDDKIFLSGKCQPNLPFVYFDIIENKLCYCNMVSGLPVAKDVFPLREKVDPSSVKAVFSSRINMISYYACAAGTLVFAGIAE